VSEWSLTERTNKRDGGGATGKGPLYADADADADAH
jgi:hypothetical protein